MHKRISNFLHKKYLCTLCCVENDLPWANAFYYIFDQENNRLIYVSSELTHHAKVIQKNENVAGTIFTPTRFTPSLQGLQFTGKSRKLEGEHAEYARSLYKKAFQHEIIDTLAVWDITLEYVRLLDHSLGMFGIVEWRVGDPDVPTDDVLSNDFTSK